MAKVSFNQPGGVQSMTAPVQPQPAAPAPAVPAVPDAATGTATFQAPPPPATPFSDEYERFDPGDLVLPRLNIVQNVGQLCDTFTPGTLVLDGTLVLSEAPKDKEIGKPVRIVILGLQPTVFAEKLEGGERGEVFNTEAEVHAAGGTLDYNEAKRTDKQLYQRVSTGLLLIEQPAGLDDVAFPYEVLGKRYVLALYTMKGVGYTNAARHFKSAKKIGHLRGVGYRGGFWTLASKLEQYGKNKTFRPVVKAADSTTEQFRAAVRGIVGF